MRIIAFLFLFLLIESAAAQNGNTARLLSGGRTVPAEVPQITGGITSDTTPVWIVFLDSVRVFAAYPGVDMRTDVVAGWRVFTIHFDGFNFTESEAYFDTNGVSLDVDMVLFAKRRKVTPNPFRQ